MASVMNLSGYVVVGHDHAQADVFTVISVHIVGMFGLVLVVGQLVDRVGRRRTLIAGLLVMAVSTVMLAWVVSIQALSISLFLLGLGWNLSYVAASAELVTHARPVERGRLVGFTDLIAGLAAAALALIGGLAYSEWGVVALAVGATVRGRRAGARHPASRAGPADPGPRARGLTTHSGGQEAELRGDRGSPRPCPRGESGSPAVGRRAVSCHVSRREVGVENDGPQPKSAEKLDGARIGERRSDLRESARAGSA